MGSLSQALGHLVVVGAGHEVAYTRGWGPLKPAGDCVGVRALHSHAETMSVEGMFEGVA
jgi:hypothetical protein